LVRRLVGVSAAVGHSIQSAGVDYSHLALRRAVGTLLSGIKLVTIIKMRVRYAGMMKMPIFTWTALCTNILIVASFPVLTAVLAPAVHGPLPGHRLLFERLWRQLDDVRQPDLISHRGLHPDPAAVRCVLKSSRPSAASLFGYASMVYATLVITICLCRVAAPLLHHGIGASVAFFGITTMIISDPDRGKDQLAVHHVPGPHPLRSAHAVDNRLHGHLHHRRDDGAGVPPPDFVLHNSLF
jgi:cytochrome o ubiquinol oxidase subunit 1